MKCKCGMLVASTYKEGGMDYAKCYANHVTQIIKIQAASRLLAKDSKWSEKVGKEVKINHEGAQKPVELEDSIFAMQPSAMVQKLKAIYKDDFKAAMSAVSFVANRQGRNLSPSEKERFKRTKELLRKAYGRETTNPATRPH